MARPIEYDVRAAPVEATAREELDRLLETCHRHGLLRLANDLVAANTENGEQPPGLLGIYRLMRDEELWRAPGPLIEGLKGFAEGLEKPISNPISDFSGKPGRAS